MGKTLATLAVCGLAMAAIGPAAATPSSGFTPSGLSNGNFGVLNENTAGDKTDKWGYHLKTLADTDIGVDRLTLDAGGHSGWHAHPGPVFVTVIQGSVRWYDGTDPLCGSKTYTQGQSFIEQPYKVHYAANASASVGAQYVAVTVKPAGFVGPAFRIDQAKPNNCNF